MWAKRYAVRIVGSSAAIIGGSTVFYYTSDEGTKRSLQFWKSAFPIFLHYRFYQLLNRDLGILNDEIADKRFEELHKMYADKVRELVYSLRGFYLKHAQLMSTQVL
jgi:predicted unusual protein kinase regulating ubiquinone biosynthesis (AarF/ABC1/UbiB family)